MLFHFLHLILTRTQGKELLLAPIRERYFYSLLLCFQYISLDIYKTHIYYITFFRMYIAANLCLMKKSFAMCTPNLFSSNSTLMATLLLTSYEHERQTHTGNNERSKCIVQLYLHITGEHEMYCNINKVTIIN